MGSRKVKVGKHETGQEAAAKSIGDMASSVNRLVEKLDQSDDIAKEAGQRARSAHHRLDDVKAELEKKKIESVKLIVIKRLQKLKMILNGYGVQSSELSLQA